MREACQSGPTPRPSANRSPVVVARAPRTGELHSIAPTEVPPAGLAAGIQLLCSDHGTHVPVVRPYVGDFDETRALSYVPRCRPGRTAPDSRGGRDVARQ